ncbi:ATP-binding protein [Actinoallomurus sp. NPDC052308]|uniref:ATP-binding protein n=1 Tax=Actinoallomurus sp. NPDC052308 TaxID=3155530 RepID=UPI003435C7DB
MLTVALPSAVGRARAYTRWVLGAWGLDGERDTVELLVSELVTNAVNATGVPCDMTDQSNPAGKVNPIYLCLSIVADALHIEVWDVSEETPRKRASLDKDEDGRGLLLVETLSKEWGCNVLQSGGKIVWCKYLIGVGA